jgi:hypothetical protein
VQRIEPSDRLNANRIIIQRDERRGECGPSALDPDYPSPSDYGWFNSRGYQTLKQVWGGIAINVKCATIPDTSLRKIKTVYPEQIPSCHHGSDNPWGICLPSLHLHPDRPSTTSVR